MQGIRLFFQCLDCLEYRDHTIQGRAPMSNALEHAWIECGMPPQSLGLGLPLVGEEDVDKQRDRFPFISLDRYFRNRTYCTSYARHGLRREAHHKRHVAGRKRHLDNG